jgi:hypothetical protein
MGCKIGIGEPVSRAAERLQSCNSVNILTVNLLFSTFVFWIAAKLYVLPRLPTA